MSVARPLYRRVCMSVGTPTLQTCVHEYVHAHSTDVCARVWARPLYRRVCMCVHAHSTDVCAHECGHTHSTDVCAHECGTPTLQMCVPVWARPLYRRVCPCGHAHSPSALPPGSDRCGAALGRGPAPPLLQEPAPLGAPPALAPGSDRCGAALAGRGPGGPLCFQPRQQPSLLAASGATQEPMRPHGQTGKEGAPFLTERELVNGRQAGSKGRHPRTTAGTLTREASVGVSGGATSPRKRRCTRSPHTQQPRGGQGPQEESPVHPQRHDG